MIAFPSFRGCLSTGAAAAWSPSSLSPVVWLDASDTSTLFDATSGGSLPTDGAATARWVDKSTNAYSYIQSTTTAGYRPKRIVGASSTGKDVLRFYDLYVGCALNAGATSIGRNCSGVTILAAAKFHSSPTGLAALFAARNNAGSNRLYLDGGRSSNKLGISGRRLSSDSFVSLYSSTSITTDWSTYGGILDFADSASYTYINSSTYDSTNQSFQTSGNSEDAQSSDSTVGGSGGLTPPTVDIGEIIIVNRALNSTEMNDAVTYLNNKW